MKKLNSTANFTFLITLLILSSCASRPKLYPNSIYKQNGKEKADADIKVCMKEAEDYLDSDAGKKVIKGAGFGAAVGGAMGAVTGLFFGDVAGGAARGAAIGGTGGAVSSSLTPDQFKERYVNRCLHEKGYEVLGWN